MKKIFSILFAFTFILSITQVNTIAYIEPQNTALELFYEGFENGFGGCEVAGSESLPFVTYVTEGAYMGNGAVKISDNSTTNSYGIRTPYIEVAEGEEYTGSFYINNLSGFSVRVYIRYYDESKNILSSQSFAMKEKGWKAVSGSVVAPENSKYAQLYISGASVETGECLVDEVRFHKGIYTPPFVYNFSNYTPPIQQAPQNAYVVEPGESKLIYNPYNDEGDTLSDFSYAGFYEGKYLPPESENLEVIEILSPSNIGDDTALIQSAIDRCQSTDGNIRIVKLRAGKYYINKGGLKLKSGVLLSGEGQGPSGTILYSYEKEQCTTIHIEGSAYTTYQTAKITDDYVKAGSRSITIESDMASQFKAGDKIVIRHISTDEWADAIEMVNVPTKSGTVSWKKDTIKVLSERMISSIWKNKITLNYGVFMPHMKNLVPSYIAKIDTDNRLQNAGVENLRIESYYNGNRFDEQHATGAIEIENAKNIIIRNVTSKYFYMGLVRTGSGAKNVTVENCSCLEPVSLIVGNRRYSFLAANSSQSILINGCYSYDARHDYATSTYVSGPIVFLDSVSEMSNAPSETHMNWGTGVLYDNIYQTGSATDGYLSLANRGVYNHGWTSSNCVIWNGLSNAIVVSNPPLSYTNLAVGVWGLYNDTAALEQKNRVVSMQTAMYQTGVSSEPPEGALATDENTPMIGDGYKESQYTPVEPRSLFKAQLAQRYAGSYKNVRPNAPIVTNPYPDLVSDSTSLTVTGIYQLGAENVTVYIDDAPYNATLDEENNTFSLTLSVAEGTHKVYATQTIDGVEGNKTADRFVSAKRITENTAYLQSTYPKEKTTMLVNDKRKSYDETLPKTVRFETNGGSTVENAVVEAGKKLTKPENPERDGYTFVAWCTDESLSEEYDFSLPVVAPLTLYAKWSEKMITASASLVGGTLTANVRTHQEILGRLILVALFDEKGVMSNLAIMPANENFSEKGIAFSDAKDTSYVKVFVWEAYNIFKSLQLCEKIEL